MLPEAERKLQSDEARRRLEELEEERQEHYWERFEDYLADVHPDGLAASAPREPDYFTRTTWDTDTPGAMVVPQGLFQVEMLQ